ncbi:hypothetical protein [Streptomyces coeruleorubidus]|uniref:hypothetical protein n=1 Tax=Streptomyces coeruleorubidus TaxID=116188 RepID=UPI0037AC9086
MSDDLQIQSVCDCYYCRPYCIFCGAEGSVEDPLPMEAMQVGGRDHHGRTKAELACLPCARLVDEGGWDAAWAAQGAKAELSVVLNQFCPVVRWELKVWQRPGMLVVAGDLDDEHPTDPVPDVVERHRLLAEAGYHVCPDTGGAHRECNPWRWSEESALIGVPEGVTNCGPSWRWCRPRTPSPAQPAQAFADDAMRSKA